LAPPLHGALHRRRGGVDRDGRLQRSRFGGAGRRRLPPRRPPLGAVRDRPGGGRPHHLRAPPDDALPGAPPPRHLPRPPSPRHPPRRPPPGPLLRRRPPALPPPLEVVPRDRYLRRRPRRLPPHRHPPVPRQHGDAPRLRDGGGGGPRHAPHPPRGPPPLPRPA